MEKTNSIDFTNTSRRLWRLRKYDKDAYEQLMELFDRSISICQCQSACDQNCQCMEYIHQFLDQIELTLITN